MKYWRDNGTPVEKLNMGFATYGRTFRLTSSDTSVGAPASGPASAGPYTREAGFWAYYEVRAWLLGAKTFNTKMLSKVRNQFFIVIPRMLYNGDLCMSFSRNKLPFCVFCSDLHLHKWRNSWDDCRPDGSLCLQGQWVGWIWQQAELRDQGHFQLNIYHNTNLEKKTFLLSH